MVKVQELDLEAGVEATPIPPVEANVTRFVAGALTFGVEYRRLDSAVSRQNLELNRQQGRQIAEDLGESQTEEAEGPSIHVFASDDGGEYLRFDCFDNEPHYHYIDPQRPWVNRLTFDPVANGDMLSWTIAALRSRLPQLLSRTDTGAALAARVDLQQVQPVLDEVERCARNVLTTPRNPE